MRPQMLFINSFLWNCLLKISTAQKKIAYLDQELPTDNVPTSCDPDAGHLCYYIPWGNLCFFYQDFRASTSLIPVGQVESGFEFLKTLDTASIVTVEAVH